MGMAAGAASALALRPVRVAEVFRSSQVFDWIVVIVLVSLVTTFLLQSRCFDAGLHRQVMLKNLS